MTSWFINEIKSLTNIEGYKRPNKVYDVFKLDSNENFYISKEFIQETLKDIITDIDLREYPIDEYNHLYKKLSIFHKIDSDCFSIGNGSDQLIDLILSIFGRGRSITIHVPTFSYFINRCELYKINLHCVPLNNSNSIDDQKFIECAKRADLVYLCSPNNPTGNQFDRNKMEKIIKELNDKLIILDEAYAEFAEYSLISQVDEFENLLVLRTFSKAFGLAGARIGYLATNKQISQIFNTVIQLPYPLNKISLRIANSIIDKSNEINDTINKIKKERDRVYNFLLQCKEFKVTASNSNFIFFEAPKLYNKLLENLRKNKIIVKEFDDLYGRKGCIRFTIGTKHMNDKFIESVKLSLAHK